MIRFPGLREAALLLAGALTSFAASIARADAAADQFIEQAYDAHRSHVQVEDQGEVIKLLPDDTEGARHQRFIVRLDDGRRLLFAYNIDLAPRIDALQRGDTIEFRGEYIYNAKGGIVHWTHRDPSGHHADGYIRLDGRVYQ